MCFMKAHSQLVAGTGGNVSEATGGATGSHPPSVTGTAPDAQGNITLCTIGQCFLIKMAKIPKRLTVKYLFFLSIDYNQWQLNKSEN